jgi:imidazole glycerol-phosphate synthase subunit HisH
MRVSRECLLQKEFCKVPASYDTVIVDYGMGNLLSVEKAILAVGGHPLISADPETILGAERIILPGVGAFGDAMRNLAQKGLDNAIRTAVYAGKPLLGLCLGLQLLFSHSEEFGSHEGLGLIPGTVRRFDDSVLRVPHVGWNQIESVRPDPLLKNIPDGSYFYFVHSYFVAPDKPEYVLTWTSYGGSFCSIACRDKVWGAQFHPEKSQEMGKRLLRNFLAVK